MKLAIRTLALTLVSYWYCSRRIFEEDLVRATRSVPSLCPMPTCPLNSGGCGIWK